MLALRREVRIVMHLDSERAAGTLLRHHVLLLLRWRLLLLRRGLNRRTLDPRLSCRRSDAPRIVRCARERCMRRR
jgi:hypothetical protein